MTSRAMFPTDDAEAFFKKNAGKKYRPSNGTEGEIFVDNFCADCVHDADHRADPEGGDGCAILAATLALDIDHPDYPAQWIWGEDGQPRCTAHCSGDDPALARCAETMDLFG
jgi:hypothetical protein